MATKQKRDSNADSNHPVGRTPSGRGSRNRAKARRFVGGRKAEIPVLLPKESDRIDLTLKPVPLPLAGGYYELARDLLIPAYAEDPYLSVTEHDSYVMQLLRQGLLLLWVVEDKGGHLQAALLTQIARFGPRRILRIHAGASLDMDGQIESVLSTLKAHARAEHCDFVELCGRRGWAKVLQPHGFIEAYTTVTLSLE